MITLEATTVFPPIFEEVTLYGTTQQNLTVVYEGITYYATPPVTKEFLHNISSYEIVSNFNPYNIIKIDGNKIIWNGLATTPSNPIQITLKIIFSNGTLKIDRSNMLSFDIPIVDRSDINNASFGIYSNSGKIEFSDYNGIVPLLNPQNRYNVKVWLVNTLTKNKTMVCDTLTKEWNYDNDSKVASVSIYDGLEDWQDIHFSGIPYNFNEPTSKSCRFFYEELQKFSVGLGYMVVPFDDLDAQTQKILGETLIPYPFLNASTLWQAWTKLCVVCQLHLFKDFEGNILCKYGKGM